MNLSGQVAFVGGHEVKGLNEPVGNLDAGSHFKEHLNVVCIERSVGGKEFEAVHTAFARAGRDHDRAAGMYVVQLNAHLHGRRGCHAAIVYICIRLCKPVNDGACEARPGGSRIVADGNCEHVGRDAKALGKPEREGIAQLFG